MTITVPGSSLQVSQTVGETLSIVGYAVELSQAEVPYLLPAQGAPLLPSLTDLVVYGDTVTITGDLLNPGRSIAIYARQVVIGATTFISVAGADPATIYPPGAPAEQTDFSSGAPGAAGATGLSGTPGGTIQITAERIVSQGADTGAGTPGRAICLQRTLECAAAAALPTYLGAPNLSPISMPDINQPWQVDGMSGTVSVTGISIVGAQLARSLACTYDPVGDAFSVVATLGPLSVQATSFTLSLASPQMSWPIAFSCSFELVLTLAFSAGPTAATIVPSGNSLAIINLDLTLDLSDNWLSGVIDPLLSTTIEPLITSGLSATLNQALMPAAAGFAGAVAGAFMPASTGAGVALALLAQGGPGGRGQDGHAGINGAPGTPGQDTNERVAPLAPPPPDAVGGAGQAGGQGGDAGHSGAGGQGGTVTVNVVIAPAVGVGAAAAAGAGGAAADAGAPGTGGAGGQGGTYYVGILDGPSQQVTAPKGSAGANGAPAAFGGAMGALEQGGNATFNGAAFGQPGTYTYSQIAPALALYQLLFTQRAAKLAYLNAQSASDYQAVIGLFVWLQNVTAPFNITPQPAISGLLPTDVATRAAICQAAGLELARLNAGLNYYGDPLNWAPVLTWNWLDGRVTQQLALGNGVLQQFNSASQPSEQAAAAQNASTSIQADLANLQAAESSLQQQIDALDAQIGKLGLQIAQQVDVITQDFKTLQQQYTKQQTGCDFTDVLTALSSIVQLGLSSAYGEFNALGQIKDLTTALGYESAGANLLQSAGNLVQKLIPSDAGYTALAGAWGQLQTTLSTYGANSGLIAVANDQFDTLLNQYFSGLPEASVVEDDVDELIALNQARNQTVLNYTGLYAKLQQLSLQAAQKQAELEHVAALLAAQQQPALPDYLGFLQNALVEIGNDIADNLYQENQAFQYWAVVAQPLAISGLDMASLSVAAGQLETSVQSYLENTTGRPFSPFSNVSIFIDSATYPSAFARLAATKQLTVQIAPTISPNPFVNTYIVTAETLTVSLPGVPAPAPGTIENPTLLQLNLTQHGADAREAPDGTTLIFTHAPRLVFYEYNYALGQATVAGTIGDPAQGFTGLSPFATWTIDFSPSTNGWLDLAQVTSVQLTFGGTLLGPNAADVRDA